MLRASRISRLVGLALAAALLLAQTGALHVHGPVVWDDGGCGHLEHMDGSGGAAPEAGDELFHKCVRCAKQSELRHATLRRTLPVAPATRAVPLAFLPAPVDVRGTVVARPSLPRAPPASFPV